MARDATATSGSRLTSKIRYLRRRSGGYSTPSNQEGGLLKRGSVYAQTENEARRKLRIALGKRDAGLKTTATKESIDKYLKRWFESAKSSLRPRTAVSYEGIIRVHLVPRSGRIKLARLQPAHVQQLYADLLAEGRAPKTIRNVGLVLHRAIQQAVRWRLIESNVVGLVDLPRAEHREMQALSVEQARQVLNAAQGDDLEALWWLALSAGLRQGELFGLRWPNVDLDTGTINVVATAVRVTAKGREVLGWKDEGQRLGDPKSRRSRRRVQLSASALNVLRAHHQRALESALATGHAFDRNGFVFTREDGQPLSVTTTWKLWKRLLERASVPYVRFHDARHSAATMLLGRGVHPKIVSEMLGHSTVAITLDV
jgi:integrase